ncbi:MAG TPA: Fic family protein [Polyangiaceae bacterium]|nr:Fic family protein [Polyangiaceae bacterium]
MAKARSSRSKARKPTRAVKKTSSAKKAAKKKPVKKPVAKKTKKAAPKAKKVAAPAKKTTKKLAAAPKKAPVTVKKAPAALKNAPAALKKAPAAVKKAPPPPSKKAAAPSRKAAPAPAPSKKAAPPPKPSKKAAAPPSSRPASSREPAEPSRDRKSERRSVRRAPSAPASEPPSSRPPASSRPSMSEAPYSEPGDLSLELDEDEDIEERRQPRVEFAPRTNVVAPSIPIPVKSIPQRPSLEERSRIIDERIQKQTDDFRKQYTESFEMSWIYHDTALEGVVYTYEELASAFHGEEVPVVDSSIMPIYESIKRHKLAIEFVRDAVDKKRVPMNVDLVKKIYIILHPEEGDVKTVKYRRDIPQHRLYFHEYEAPDKIAYRVRLIVEWVNSPETRKNVSTLRISAKAHYDLARTYPFPHDSGKVARLFMNYLLLRGGLPPAIIHSTERQRYYEALKAPTAGPLVQMLKDSVDNALASIEKLLEEHETKKRGFVS